VAYTPSEKTLINDIDFYLRRLQGAKNRLHARTYANRVRLRATKLEQLLGGVVPDVQAPTGKPTLLRVEPSPTGLGAGRSTSWSFEQFEHNGMAVAWCIPSTIARPGVVVTVPGGPDGLYGAFPGQEIARMLGVRVLMWDTNDREPLRAIQDIQAGVDAARTRAAGGRVILASHSFAGLACAAAAVGSRPASGIEGYVAISSVLGLTEAYVGEPFRSAYLAANVIPDALRRTSLPVEVVASSNDIPSCTPDKAMPLANAYAQAGGRITVTEVTHPLDPSQRASAHTATLFDQATMVAISRLLG